MGINACMTQPELEKPPKPGSQLLLEGCLLLVLFAIVAAAASALVIKLLNRALN
jgi:hypothetical protein